MWASHARGYEYIIQQACFCSFPPSCESLIELSKLRSGGKQGLWCKVKDLHSSIVQWSQVPVKSDSNVCSSERDTFFFFWCWQFVATVMWGRRVDGWGRERNRRQWGKKDGVSYTQTPDVTLQEQNHLPLHLHPTRCHDSAQWIIPLSSAYLSPLIPWPVAVLSKRCLVEELTLELLLSSSLIRRRI